MMDGITDFLDKLLAVTLGSATLYGAGGAFMHARRKGKPLSQSLVEVISGAFTANMMSNVITSQVPQEWQPICFFLVGWGGLELVGRLYEAAAAAVEKRIGRKLGGE